MLKNIQKFSLAEIEEKVLLFWKEHAIFEKSLKNNKGKKKFVFFEGPPTANGRPGIHHILARSFKDVVLRYKTMNGFYVPRRGGWDTHGLPVELEVEKKLGFSTKRDIEEFGIAPFNEKCRESVWTYKDEWEKLTTRMGFWLDLDNPYVTYRNSYIETLWWVFGEAWKKKLLYRGHKVVPWCPRCGTGLSSHELALGYKEIEDTSVYVKFKVKKGEKIGPKLVADDHTYILSWTTTPWTLPGNVALAVGKNIQYVAVRTNKTKELLILGKDLVNKVLVEHTIEKSYVLNGDDLVGVAYKPLFKISAFEKSDTAYKVYPADFVTTTDGTGVVHTAVMYGEDDYNLGTKVGLPAIHTVNEQGEFTDAVLGFAGMKVKNAKTEALIIHALEEAGNLLGKEKYKHEYPFCWRCSSALIYYARNSWFIRMSSLRQKLITENKKINWIPDHLQNGRFGEWIKEVKDWAISRERFWGTPLPIWECDSCGETRLVGSADAFDRALNGSTNNYIFMRHGEAENNTRHLINSWPEPEKLPLTLKGNSQVEKTARLLKKEKIDVIYASDITRTKQTAEIVARVLGIKEIHFDPRIREFDFGDYNGATYEEYAKYYGSRAEKFEKKTPNGENHTDLRKRVYEFLSDIDKKHTKKKILVVTHDGIVYMLHTIANGWSTEDQLTEKEKRGFDYVKNAGIERSKIKNVPRDMTGAFDLHRPYVDGMEFSCGGCKKGIMKRIPEVADVWFDSGAMPFAQIHYPFEKKKRALEYPADYISEAMDQTRGWFYTLLAVSVMLGKGTPYKNVISLGLVLDKNGQKMSKSKGNVVDPWDMMTKYGVDAARWYFYTVNPPGEPKRFDEAELGKVSRQLFSLLYNSFIFFDLYADKNAIKKKITKTECTLLDTWILARLNKTIARATKSFNAYDVGSAAREIEEFVNDLSRWYIRRSRKRLQRPESDKDYATASRVLGHVLRETSKLLAPFTPFFAEALYKSLPYAKESVHLEAWPVADKTYQGKVMDGVIGKMNDVRLAASAALAKRAEIAVKVRQPLSSLTIKDENSRLKKSGEFLDILKDEINVKDIVFDKNVGEDFVLDVEITHELREEGLLRELVRMIQDLRQDAGFRMRDTITLSIDATEEIAFIVNKNEVRLKNDVGARAVLLQRSEKFDAEIETKLDEWNVWIGIKKK